MMLTDSTHYMWLEDDTILGKDFNKCFTPLMILNACLEYKK